MTQAMLAKRLNVRIENVANWEHSRTIRDIRHLPEIIGFLGYNPMETGAKNGLKKRFGSMIRAVSAMLR